QKYEQAGGNLPGLSRKHIDTMRTLINSTEAKQLHLPKGVTFTVEAGRAAMARNGKETAQPKTAYTIRSKPCNGCDDKQAAHLKPGLQLTIGTRCPGLTLTPKHG